MLVLYPHGEHWATQSYELGATGHADFYRRFIKDFSKTSQHLTNLLQKDVPYVFDEDCKKAFEVLKRVLIPAPIVQPPDWNLPFEIVMLVIIL